MIVKHSTQLTPIDCAIISAAGFVVDTRSWHEANPHDCAMAEMNRKFGVACTVGDNTLGLHAHFSSTTKMRYIKHEAADANACISLLSASGSYAVTSAHPLHTLTTTWRGTKLSETGLNSKVARESYKNLT